MKCRSSLMLCLLLPLLAGCGETSQESVVQQPGQKISWKLVTAWPKNFPGLGSAPEELARRVEMMSGGRFRIRVYGAGELVPALEVFDAVSQGTAEAGHSSAYYWKGKIPAAQFFTTVPFGFTAQEINSWMHYGGGLELFREVYAPFDLVPMVGGNTGVQMAGWFNREIRSLEDIRGIRMRIPGLAGEVFNRLGGVAVTLPAAEIYTAMQTGVIDATEWVGPYNDLALGLHEVARYCYYPGWHEPGAALELVVNKQAYESLPEDLRAILETAARAVNQDMLDEYTARNSDALQQLVTEHGVEFRRLPDDVIEGLRKISWEVVTDIAAKDPTAGLVYKSFSDFLKKVSAYHRISEQAYIAIREPGL